MEWKKIILLFTAASTNTFYFNFCISISCHQGGILIVYLQFLPGQTLLLLKDQLCNIIDVTTKVQLPEFPEPEAGAGWGDGLAFQKCLRSDRGPAPHGFVSKRTWPCPKGPAGCHWGLDSLQLHRENTPGLTGHQGREAGKSLECNGNLRSFIVSVKAVWNWKLKAYFICIRWSTFGSNQRKNTVILYRSMKNSHSTRPCLIFLFYSKVAKALLLFVSEEKELSPQRISKI